MTKRKRDSPGPSGTSASADDGDSSSGAEFEVFLSFRGPDTRLGFTDSLYETLVKGGIRVFRDYEEIRRGEKIGDEILHAIKSSKIYLPIFSRDYASSVWCLRELAHMVECSSKAKDKMILPIFYDVDPDDVKLRTPLYLDALKKHEEKFGHDVLQWKEALAEVARISGLDMKGKGHGEIIKTIVDKVGNKLMKRRRNLPEHLLGIDDQVDAIMDLSTNEGSRNVRYVVIHGMGGIGKTTLASAVFNQISNQFEGCSFLSDVRESAQRGKIIELQKKLLSDILQGGSVEIPDSDNEGINIISKRFRNKKVLLVLDDVDDWDQLSKLAGKGNWFGQGSKIIITTRDISFWKKAHYEEFTIYNMKEMDSSNSLKLFSRHALRVDYPPPQYEDISLQITKKTGGLPLALEVIGSSLFCEDITRWKDTLKKLDSMPNQEVFTKLKISYDKLDRSQREIFLDIACYFIGKERLHPRYMWEASGYFPHTDVLVLTRMSLIKIKKKDGEDIFWMHDQLRDLRREISQLPRERSRLWMPQDALNVIRRKEGTDKIVALRLRRLNMVHDFTSEEFSRLPNLRFLELVGGNLVSENLKVIHIDSCQRFPDLSKCKNLERMSAVCWRNPLAIAGSISKLEHLVDLKIWGQYDESRFGDISAVPSALRGPRSLSRLELRSLHVEELHHSIGEMADLKYLSVRFCPLRKLPDSLGKLKSLVELDLVYTKITELPDSLGKLKSLVELDLACTKITELPDSIGDLKMLTKMDLRRTPIKKLPNSIGGLESLIELRLEETHITELPACIGDLKRLEILNASYSDIRELPRMLENLKELIALSNTIRGYVAFPPTDLATLSQLRVLKIPVDFRSLIGLPSSLEELHLYDLNLPMERLPFSNLTNLADLTLYNCRLREVEFEHLLGQQPEKLRSLRVSAEESLERLSVSTLKGLDHLVV